MKRSFLTKLISLILAVVITLLAFPLSVLAESVVNKEETSYYIKELRIAQGTRSEAKISLEDEGYIFLDNDLNEGTGEDGIWLGYKTTTDPTEAIYDIKLMNMNGGFTLTSMDEAIKAQESTFTEMALDLEMLIEEFVAAYKDDLVSAKKAYKALNFFRLVEGEEASHEANGLGYQLVHGVVTIEMITEIIMFCDPVLVDSIVKILAMGIQMKNENWMEKLSKLGPYDEDVEYGMNEDGTIRLSKEELTRRANQLAMVIDMYSTTYRAFDKLGLVSGDLDSNFDIGNANYKTPNDLSPEELSAKNADEGRYKIYKVVYDELEKHSYGAGQTLKDLFSDEVRTTELYPLVSVLSDGEFAAMSYGCFLEVALGANVKDKDFDNYDEVYEEVTAEVDSIYLYSGVDEALLTDDSIVGFTEEATRHMAATGEMEFFENDTMGEAAFKKGKNVAMILGATGMAVIAVSRVTMGVTIIASTIISMVAHSAAKSAISAGIIKICSIIGGPWTFLITVTVVALTIFVSWLISVIDEEINGKIDWEDNPMPEYLYDVKEVSFVQKSENEGVVTEYMMRPVFGFYEAVCDENGQVADLNARSGDASQWVGLYVSYDILGDDAKPIEANSFKVQHGNGEIPDGYKPLTRFSEVFAYNLNLWDGEDECNGIYVFYKQDESAPPVDDGVTYYIKDVYLQSGESPAHCISLLESKGYTPLNVNLSPDAIDFSGITLTGKRIYTYLGYKTSTDGEHACRDIRVVYGPNQGEIKFGNANYSECGSNGFVTLYATKYIGAGSPILAGGIKCVNDRADAPAGYEPVNFFGGGPAVSFNYESEWTHLFSYAKGVEFDTEEFFLYFLPEQSFTDGPEYLGGISFMNVDTNIWTDINISIDTYGDEEEKNKLYHYLKEKNDKQSTDLKDILRDYLLYRSDYRYTFDSDPFNTVAYYITHNPYRAIYNMAGTNILNTPEYFNLENLGYVCWNRARLYKYAGNIYIDYNEVSQHGDLDFNGKFYVSGNPLSDNLYDEKTGQMTKQQPLSMSDVVCLSTVNGIKAGDMQNTDFKAVNEVFNNNDSIVEIFNNETVYFEYDDDYVENNVVFFIAKETKERPYISGIVAIDELTLYRASGGHDEGMKREYITDAMLYKQLAAQGATNFCGHRVSLGQATTQKLNEMNAIRFGYVRGSSKSLALTDIFIYVNDFSFDEPPKYMYRNNIQYFLLCEIPYNLTGYEGAPSPGVWLYGTTDNAAGARIVDFDVSGTPFMPGYETVRTQNGRSPWAELRDMMEKNENDHFFGWAAELFEDLLDFFTIMDRDTFMFNNYFEHEPYYLHIKREGDPLTAQKPYIGELYLADYHGHKIAALDELFDMGADEYINVDLNMDAGGEYILLGYSRTESAQDAIRDIYAYHDKNPAATMTASDGRKYKLVSDLDLNYQAGGDYIYLYTTKEGDNPILELEVGFAERSVASPYTETMADGDDLMVFDGVVKKWGTSTSSDLNEEAGGAHLYMFYTKVYRGEEDGSYKKPVTPPAPTFNRDGFDEEYLDPDGRYIAEIYVMDKETIRKELGYSSCYTISDKQVFDRLRQMGATEIIETPISANSRDFDIWNHNKVYIGYSRTDDEDEAIKDIAIHVELISHLEPQENITINKRGYKLVAEAASDAKELPKAINLLGIGDGNQVAFPKMYLYTTTSGTQPPITDICIDQAPLIQGWNTVKSSNGVDAFVDVMDQAHEQYLLADKDDLDSYDEELVYTDSLFEWMDDLSAMFDPAEENVTIFYIHTKNYVENSVEDARPYIEQVFLASGDTRHDALTQLVAFSPDGFVDVDLNSNAGGKYVYLAYKRTDKATAALRDLMICEGENPANTRRVEVNGVRIKYDIVAGVDLNDSAGGKYLYLYATESSRIGNPIKTIGIVEDDIPTYHVRCGLELNAVLLVEKDKNTNIDKFTDECIDLNKGCGIFSDYLYMYMIRETSAGHTLVGYSKTVKHQDPTCGKDGYHIEAEVCLACNQKIENKTVLEATGKHVDADNDGDHRCDVCKKRNVTGCVRGKPEESNIVAPHKDEDGNFVDGSCNIRYKCAECNKLLSTERGVVIPATPENIAKYAEQTPASIFGEGSIVAICIFSAIGVFAALLIPIIRNKNKTKETDEK